MATVDVSGTGLSLEDIEAVARAGARVSLPAGASNRVKRARRAVEEKLASGETVYGLNTGFGDLRNVRIPRERLRDLQVNLVRSHAAGVGEPFPPDVVRAIMLLRANSFARGHSGVTPGLVRRLLQMLNAGVTPVVPSQGSVGSSGDLAPLAHVALALLGEGDVTYRGRAVPAARALKAAGMARYRLREKEGISLVNGTQAMTAEGALALLDAERALRAAAVAGAMALECTDSSLEPFDARIHRTRPHLGASAVAAAVVRLTRGSEQVKSHEDCDKVQDPYSTRALPQVLGASLDAMRYVRSVLEVEVNSATDNPLVFPSDGEVLSGGNFHGQPVALAMDFLAIATAEVADIMERTIARLVSGDEGHLPRFLAREPGLHSGWMIAQYTAAALVSENKALAHPASVDSIPTSAGQEDHNSMGTIAARKARAIVDNTTQVAGIALLLAAEGLELHGGRPGRGCGGALKAVRRRVRPLRRDRPLYDDLAAGAALVRSGEAVGAAQDAGARLGF
jgi:histidine ammonia-lyase